MRKINSSFFGIFVVLFCFFSVQTVSAVDVPLKKGDTGAGGINPMLGRSASTAIPVIASLNDTELGVFFSKYLGVAQVTILDETGSIVYQEMIDTSSTPETYVEIGGFDSGNYTLKVTYNTISIVGAFEL